jgi:RimJ/RimL family protein N-acetyltransferase
LALTPAHPSIEIARLHIRAATPTDASFVSELFRDAAVREYLGGPLTKEVADDRAQTATSTPMALVAVERATDSRLGEISFDNRGHDSLELSYAFLPRNWGFGYAEEAVRASLSWVRSIIGDNELLAITQATNHRSRRLLERLGGELIAQFVEFGSVQFSCRLP